MDLLCGVDEAAAVNEKDPAQTIKTVKPIINFLNENIGVPVTPFQNNINEWME